MSLWMPKQGAKRRRLHKRQRVVRVFRECCQTLAKRVAAVCEDEKIKNRLSFGIPRARIRAANLLGISPPSLYRLLKKDPEQMPSGGGLEERNRGMKMSEMDAAVIRPALVSLIIEKKPVHLDSLLSRLKLDNPEWIWSRATLHRALQQRCGITFVKRQDMRYTRMREDPVNMQRRAWYLKYFFDYTEQGRPFVFMDESWLNKNMVPSFCWSDGTVDSELNVPSGKGERWIMIGAGSKDGWIQPSIKMWKGKVLSEDYHTEMNGDVFEHWMKQHLLPYVAGNSCIVIDRAPYHTMLTDDSKPAAKNMKREELIDWLIAHGAKDEDGELLSKEHLLSDEMIIIGPSGRQRKQKGWTKQLLYALAASLTPKPHYLAQEWVDTFNTMNGTDIRLLLLPVAHPVLNPIELMWGQIKRYVRDNNCDFTMSHIRELAEQKIQEQDSRAWNASFQHTWKYATQQWQADEMLLEDEEGSADDEESHGDQDDDQEAQEVELSTEDDEEEAT